jgi:hypothetical protein
MMHNRSTRFGFGRQAALLASAVLIAATVGCDSLLKVEAPSRVLASDLESPASAALLVNGAVADFECALGSYVLAFGLITDEVDDAALSQSQFDFDRRSFTATGGTYSSGLCGSAGVYVPVSTARYTADKTLKSLDGWTDAQVAGRAELIAKAAAYAGYSYILLGEGFCSAAVDAGPELTPAAIFKLAEDRFTLAINTTKDASIKNLALVGRARARLNQGKLTDADADAKLIPDGFVYNARYNDAVARTRNLIFSTINRGQNATIAPPYRNLTFGGVTDPRTAVTNTGKLAFDQVNLIWTPNKYPAIDTSIPIAKWQEAQLIIAEVEGGQAAVAAINKLHTAAKIPAFASTSATEITAQIKEERRREFFLEGQHAYDIIRLKLPLNPAVGTPFPKGGSYGSMTCLPLPDVERNNNPTLNGGKT